jgi:pyrimidine operon attenuation protein/uracil phosphoribosyltransferase
MDKEKSLILTEQEVLQKIRRIAYEIYEKNFAEAEMVIAGVTGNGFTIAKILAEELTKISPFRISLVNVTVDKHEPLKSEVKIDVNLSDIKGKCVVLVDDVINTGRTFIQSLKPFLNIETRKIETAVLVNRSHRLFPISADYTGYELSTTIHEHIKVELDQDPMAVFLY